MTLMTYVILHVVLFRMMPCSMTRSSQNVSPTSVAQPLLRALLENRLPPNPTIYHHVHSISHIFPYGDAKSSFIPIFPYFSYILSYISPISQFMKVPKVLGDPYGSPSFGPIPVVATDLFQVNGFTDSNAPIREATVKFASQVLDLLGPAKENGRFPIL